MRLVVGRMGRAHGVRGDVFVDVRTDEPEARFVVGSLLVTDPATVGPLTVARVRWHSGKLVMGFEGFDDRDAVAVLRGVLLVIDSSELAPLDDPDEFHDHELVGLAVRTVEGAALGAVTEVIHGPAGELLVVVPEGGGTEVLVPFVREIVPTVDVAARRIVVDPPAGLLDL